MSATIGGYTVDYIDGNIQLAKVTTKSILRDGVDGIAYMDVGFRGDPFRITATVGCSGATAASVAAITMVALCGNVVTVVLNNSETWTNLMVLSATVTDNRAIGAQTGLGTDSTYIVKVEFELQPTALYY